MVARGDAGKGGGWLMSAHCPNIGLLSDSFLENLNSPLRYGWYSQVLHLNVLNTTCPSRQEDRPPTSSHLSISSPDSSAQGRGRTPHASSHLSVPSPDCSRSGSPALLLPKSRDRKSPFPTNHRRLATEIILVSSPSLVVNYHVTLWRENRFPRPSVT